MTDRSSQCWLRYQNKKIPEYRFKNKFNSPFNFLIMSRKTKTATPPTWAEISAYFTQIDKDHMGPGPNHIPGAPVIDLTDCATVLKNAAAIYGAVYNNHMPPGGPFWSNSMCADFAAWMISADPCGTKTAEIKPDSTV